MLGLVLHHDLQTNRNVQRPLRIFDFVGVHKLSCFSALPPPGVSSWGILTCSVWSRECLLLGDRDLLKSASLQSDCQPGRPSERSKASFFFWAEMLGLKTVEADCFSHLLLLLLFDQHRF